MLDASQERFYNTCYSSPTIAHHALSKSIVIPCLLAHASYATSAHGSMQPAHRYISTYCPSIAAMCACWMNGPLDVMWSMCTLSEELKKSQDKNADLEWIAKRQANQMARMGMPMDVGKPTLAMKAMKAMAQPKKAMKAMKQPKKAMKAMKASKA